MFKFRKFSPQSGLIPRKQLHQTIGSEGLPCQSHQARYVRNEYRNDKHGKAQRQQEATAGEAPGAAPLHGTPIAARTAVGCLQEAHCSLQFCVVPARPQSCGQQLVTPRVTTFSPQTHRSVRAAVPKTGFSTNCSLHTRRPDHRAGKDTTFNCETSHANWTPGAH